MVVYERHEVFPCHLEEFMMSHVDESIIFREKHQELICLDLVHDMPKAEFNMTVLDGLLTEESVHITSEEKAAIEYAIECIKTLDDMGILKGDVNE